MNPDNPLSDGQPDQLPEDEQFYGYDPEGPSPFENSDNVVVAPPVNMENVHVIQCCECLMHCCQHNNLTRFLVNIA